MIFVGDVAIAHGDQFVFKGFDAVFRDAPICVNLEGAVVGAQNSPQWGVYNSQAWHRSFESFRLGPVFIGNNHILDVPNGINLSKIHLGELGIRAFGAGDNEVDAAQPAIARSGGHDYLLIGFGWPVIGCKSATVNNAGVNRFEGKAAVRQVASALAIANGSRVIVVVHANYEFEKYPQRGHRLLAHALIDEGVYAVIFHHPHVVGSVEQYKGRTIAYSLGNWSFSYGRFFFGRLKFPEASFEQIAIQLGDTFDQVHMARFEPPDVVAFKETQFVGCENFTLRPDFEGLSHQEYEAWFRANRVKRRGLPVYSDPNATFWNYIKDCLVATRQVAIDVATRAGIKSQRRRS